MLAFLGLLGVLNLQEVVVSTAEPDAKDAAKHRIAVLGDSQKGLANLSRITALRGRGEIRLRIARQCNLFGEVDLPAGLRDRRHLKDAA